MTLAQTFSLNAQHRTNEVSIVNPEVTYETLFTLPRILYGVVTIDEPKERMCRKLLVSLPSDLTNIESRNDRHDNALLN